MKSFEEIYSSRKLRIALIKYFLKNIAGELLTLFLVMLVSYVFSIWENVFKIFILFATLRVLFGGYHTKSRLRCVALSTLTLNIGGLISLYIFKSSIYGNIFVVFLLFLLSYVGQERRKRKEYFRQ